jgi:hypothetical protein
MNLGGQVVPGRTRPAERGARGRLTEPYLSRPNAPSAELKLPRILYEPAEEIVVHQVLEYDNKSFFEEVMRQNLAQQMSIIPTVNWIDGIAFSIWRFPETDDVIRDALDGKLHLFSVAFTRVGYQTHFPITLANQDIKVPLRNASNNPNYVSLVAFLKDFKPNGAPVPVTGSGEQTPPAV